MNSMIKKVQEETGFHFPAHVKEVLVEEVKKECIAFAEWLHQNTTAVDEDYQGNDVILYSYWDKHKEVGNYTPEDIYNEFKQSNNL